MSRLMPFLAALLVAFPASAEAPPDPADWPAVLNRAEGQHVFWHAWGGSGRTNDFIDWVAGEVRDRHGVRLTHVKLADTADAVGRVLAERAAGQTDDGAVDLIWINGENFAAMKTEGLLYGPFAEDLPNYALADVAGKALDRDVTLEVEGYESPWSLAQVVFMHDTAHLAEPLPDMAAILDWAEANPGRFTFPQPPDFLGSAFLKQALYDLTEDPQALIRPAKDADYIAATAPLWAFLDALTPHLWRQGRAYPQSGPQQIQMMADGEIDLAISFSPGEASAAIANFELPDTVRTFVLEGGTLGNASYVAIPFNSGAKAGAMVVADFLLSPRAQARAQDPDHLGVTTVLDIGKLDPDARALFADLRLGPATLPPQELGETLPEPHPSWTARLEADWEARYGRAR